MLLALNAFRVVSSGPPPEPSRTSIGLLLALTRPIATVPVEPPVEPPISVPAPSYTGGASRGRMIRRRRKDEIDLEPPPLSPSPPDLKPPAPGATPPDLKPPPPGLMADVAMPQPKPLPPHLDEDEEEIALLLELLS